MSIPDIWWIVTPVIIATGKMVKVAHTRLPSIGFRSWSRFLAVSLQEMWVIKRAVGCHFRQACSYPRSSATSFAAWWTEAQWVWTVCLRLLPDSVATAIWTPGPTVPESSTLITQLLSHPITGIHTHTRLTALCPGLPRCAGTRKVKPIWILLKQETVGGSGISWAICKSAPRSRQITMPAPHHSISQAYNTF